MSILDTADAFLAASVRQAMAGEQWPHWPEHLSDTAALQETAARIEFHGIAVLLAQHADQVITWPEPIAAAVFEEARLAGLWEETHRRPIVKLIEALATAGVGSMVMKGTGLAYLLYDDPAVRRRGDTDLLIAPRDLELTRQVLGGLGFYRRDDPHGLHFQESWLINAGAEMIHAVDLHWEPADRPMLQKILKGEEFRATSVPVPRLSDHAAAPDHLLMLVHGAINQAWHVARGFFVEEERIKGGRRLIWSVDYAKLTRGYSEQDWERLAGFCEERDAAAIVHAALAGAEADLGLAMPAAIMARLAKAAEGSATYAYMQAADTVSDLRADFRAAETLSAKLRLLSNGAFAPRSHLVDKYPHQAHWPTALLQARRYAELLVGNRKGAKAR